MKKPIIFLFAMLFLYSATAQRRYYVGIPFHQGCLKDSTRFVIDCLPWDYDGRLYEKQMPYYLEPLKHFLALHPGYKCNFLLYSCTRDEEQNLRFTTYQAERLVDYFKHVDTVFGRQYLNKIIPHGGPNPLFKDIQPDSSQRICRDEADFSFKSSVIIEMILKKPISMAFWTVYYSQPCEGEDFDVEPSFPGGISRLYEYLDERMDYSVAGGYADVIGVVLVEFTIEADGSVTYPEIKRELYPAFDEQALQIVSEMPRWSPALKDGRPVRCRYQMPMRYSM